MEFRCKLSEVDDMVYRLSEAVKGPLRTYEVHPTEESLGWGRSMVCEYDYNVHVPGLKLFFRDAVEFEFDEEEQDDMPIESILHCYREGEKEPDYGVYSSILNHVLWYIKDEGISIDNAEELECVIDMPYDVDLEEDVQNG
ncbi:MAG: hypothetical protein GXY08_04640 [Ruminococcus sp.]|nr:hypothetical protein [Ruminococcus sp.]